MAWLRDLANSLDNGFDRLTNVWRRVSGIDGEVTVAPHWGWGTTSRLTVTGQVRVTEQQTDKEGGEERTFDCGPCDKTDIIDDVRATLARYIERGVLGARVRIESEGAEALATTDSDGYFDAVFDAPAGPGEGVRWQNVTITLDQVPGGRQAPTTHDAEAMVVPAGVDFGIISDFDDTVMKTGIHDFRANWRMVIESDPNLREAFPGLPELYRALAFENGVQRRPVFYVSSAAWGFFDLFAKVIARHDIPRGPLFLKNYGLDETKWFSAATASTKPARSSAYSTTTRRSRSSSSGTRARTIRESTRRSSRSIPDG